MQGRQAAGLLLTLDQERRIAVMQECHIGRACCGGHGRSALMPRTANGIESFALGTPRPKVEMAAHNLTIEQIDKHVRRNHFGGGVGTRRWKVMRSDATGKCLVQDRGAVKHSPR